MKVILAGTLVSEFCPDPFVKFGEHNFNVSAGQLQRIRIARGLISECDTVLLDEPFNGLDSETKRRLIRFLRELLRSKTVILISHLPEDEAVLTDCRRYTMSGTGLARKL